MPNNIAGAQLVSVLNPDGSLVGSGGGGGSVTITGQPIQVVQGSLGPSVHNNTTFIAPLASSFVAQVTAPATGTYRIVVNTVFTGTGTGANNNNYRLQIGGATYLSPLSTPNEKSVVFTNEIVANATAAQLIQVQAINNEPADFAVNTSLSLYRVV